MRKLGFIIISILSFASLAQKPTIEARVSSNNVIVNELFELTIICNHEIDFNYPDLSDFEISPANKQYSSQTEIHGSKIYKRENFITTHAIKATKKGSFVIGSFSFKFNGQEFKTDPIAINVGDAPNENSTIRSNLNKNFYADYTTNKTEVYVGEPIYLYNKLYSRARIMDLRDFKKGNVVGNIDLKEINKDGNVHFEIEKIDGQIFQSAKFGEQIIFPTGSGQIQVEPYSISIVYDDDWFGNQINIKSLPRTILVKPLPEENMPEDFNGGVGKYNLSVVSNKDVMDAGDVVEMKVTISGTGNVHLLNQPKLDLGQSFELYGDPVIEDTFDITVNGTKGEINYTYLLKATKTGKTKLPRVHCSYFNPKEKHYISLASEELPIHVKGDPKLRVNDSEQLESNSKKLNTELTSDPLVVLGYEVPTESIWLNGSMIALVPLPLIIAFIFGFIKNKNEDKEAKKTSEKQRNKKEKELKSVLNNLSPADSKEFYNNVDHIIRQYFGLKTGISTSSINKSDIETWLLEQEYNKESIGQLMEIVNECEFHKYSSIEMTKNEEQQDRIIKILKQIVK